MFEYSSLFRLDGRRALVVGAGSGIGKTSAEALAAFGAHVTCADLDLASAERTAAAIVAAKGKGKGDAALVDVRDTGTVTAAFARDRAIDVLVSTPGINVRKPMLKISDDEIVAGQAQQILPEPLLGADRRYQFSYPTERG